MAICVECGDVLEKADTSETCFACDTIRAIEDDISSMFGDDVLIYDQP